MVWIQFPFNIILFNLYISQFPFNIIPFNPYIIHWSECTLLDTIGTLFIVPNLKRIKNEI